jgi:hypothetical protein
MALAFALWRSIIEKEANERQWKTAQRAADEFLGVRR